MRPVSDAVPPLSIVEVTTDDPDWADQKGMIFRVGYYRKSDGLDCVWLVNDEGDYCQTADQENIKKHFTILRLSEEENLFGLDRPVIGPRFSS